MVRRGTPSTPASTDGRGHRLLDHFQTRRVDIDRDARVVRTLGGFHEVRDHLLERSLLGVIQADRLLELGQDRPGSGRPVEHDHRRLVQQPPVDVVRVTDDQQTIVNAVGQPQLPKQKPQGGPERHAFHVHRDQ